MQIIFLLAIAIWLLGKINNFAGFVTPTHSFNLPMPNYIKGDIIDVVIMVVLVIGIILVIKFYE